MVALFSIQPKVYTGTPNFSFQTQVDGYEDPGSYIRKIKYDISMENIVAIIKGSQKCEQFVKFECFIPGFWFTGSWWVQSYSWWVSREGANMTYWGGAQPGSNKCQCGMTNSCISSSPYITRRCNCDQNLSINTDDSGYLEDKNTLPVSELRFGDTGTYDYITQANEYGSYTLGKLRCWG